MPGTPMPTTAAARLERAAATLGRWDTPLESALLAVVDRRFTDEIDTVAVQLRRDGVAQLLANPAFVCDLEADDVAFVLCHEALHLLFNHLLVARDGDRAWRVACEVVINHWVQRHTGRPLPRSQSTGRPLGVDPADAYAAYAQAVDDPVAFERFVHTDEGCAQQLRRMPATPAGSGCRHLDLGAGSGTAGTVAEDRDEGEALEALLERLVQRAVDGDQRLHGQLSEVLAASDTSPVWGRVGGEQLRATSARLGDTGLWQRQLAHVLGSQLADELHPAYDRKAGWWDAALLAPLGIDLDEHVGMPLILAADGRTHRRVAVFIDTSGSIPDPVVDAAAQTIGEVAEATVDWHTFDHAVHPFEPGEPLVGRGGTSFDVIVDHLAATTDDPRDADHGYDAVVVLTDGYAPPIAPPDPDRWIWLIVADGDPWPRDHGMRTVAVPELGQEH